MKIALVGVTGLVGEVMMQVLAERKFPISDFIPVASEKSIGASISFNNKDYAVVGIDDALTQKPDIALFSAGADISFRYAKNFAEAGTFVVDNSSAWRMAPDIPLIIPEINGELLSKKDTLVANPNCSTIQMLMVLHPLHREYTIKRVVVSTYQSVSGTGKIALKQMENERANIQGEKAYPHSIDLNCFPHCDVFSESGYTKEEDKLINETHKILDNRINITATAVRIPVTGGHSESVNIEFDRDFEAEKVIALLENMPGVVVYDNPEKNMYPMPVLSKGKDEVFVGRIRRDFSQPKSLNLWITADNLRKGAATNAVQIAELIKDKFL